MLVSGHSTLTMKVKVAARIVESRKVFMAILPFV
jgi:hypothetical protein